MFSVYSSNVTTVTNVTKVTTVSTVNFIFILWHHFVNICSFSLSFWQFLTVFSVSHCVFSFSLCFQFLTVFSVSHRVFSFYVASGVTVTTVTTVTTSHVEGFPASGQERCSGPGGMEGLNWFCNLYLREITMFQTISVLHQIATGSGFTKQTEVNKQTKETNKQRSTVWK